MVQKVSTTLAIFVPPTVALRANQDQQPKKLEITKICNIDDAERPDSESPIDKKRASGGDPLSGKPLIFLYSRF